MYKIGNIYFIAAIAVIGTSVLRRATLAMTEC